MFAVVAGLAPAADWLKAAMAGNKLLLSGSYSELGSMSARGDIPSLGL